MLTLITRVNKFIHKIQMFNIPIFMTQSYNPSYAGGYIDKVHCFFTMWTVYTGNCLNIILVQGIVRQCKWWQTNIKW